jgi:hypothetical protein
MQSDVVAARENSSHALRAFSARNVTCVYAEWAETSCRNKRKSSENGYLPSHAHKFYNSVAKATRGEEAS